MKNLVGKIYEKPVRYLIEDKGVDCDEDWTYCYDDIYNNPPTYGRSSWRFSKGIYYCERLSKSLTDVGMPLNEFRNKCQSAFKDEYSFTEYWDDLFNHFSLLRWSGIYIADDGLIYYKRYEPNKINNEIPKSVRVAASKKLAGSTKPKKIEQYMYYENDIAQEYYDHVYRRISILKGKIKTLIQNFKPSEYKYLDRNNPAMLQYIYKLQKSETHERTKEIASCKKQLADYKAIMKLLNTGDTSIIPNYEQKETIKKWVDNRKKKTS